MLRSRYTPALSASFEYLCYGSKVINLYFLQCVPASLDVRICRLKTVPVLTRLVQSRRYVIQQLYSDNESGIPRIDNHELFIHKATRIKNRKNMFQAPVSEHMVNGLLQRLVIE